jgi:serine/threonine-protein kinase
LDPNFSRWERFLDIFKRMVDQGGGDQNAFSAVSGRVQDLGEIGKKALYQHNVLGDVSQRAREGRADIAEQMAGLNTQAKEIRGELTPLRVAAERHGDKTKSFPDEALELHQEIVRWEGRFGFTEPYKELADAYRAMADLIEKWWSVRSAQLTCEQDAAEKEERLHSIDQQLDELREALRIHESNLSEEVKATEAELADLGQQADKIELELLDLSSRFTAPLRSQPQLGPLFRELAQA